MRDMFHNYDHNIDKKEYPKMPCVEDDTRILQSDPNLQLVLDAFGNEIGICARHGEEFTLYFMLDGEVWGSSIRELVSNSVIVFEINDYWHKNIITKNLTAEDAFCDDTIYVTITKDEALKLKQETYKMRLSLSWPGGGYELYSEHNGFLTIK